VGLVDVRCAAACITLLLFATTGCGRSPATPNEVAQAYFRCLARDPIRTLPLVTPEFHRRHALRVATADDARAAAEHRAPADGPAAFSLDRHQLGWLAVLARPELERRVERFALQLADATEQGDVASVAVQVDPRDAPPFEQRFAMVRSHPGAPWRIDSIEQREVAPASAFAAFAAYPNESARRALAQRRAP
jgi:hypothetical protein